MPPSSASVSLKSERDITKYGVSIVRASVAPGSRYWKIVNAYHLSGAENQGRHHLFVDMLNADGTRRIGAHCNLWVGDKVFIGTVDKPAGEPGTNFPMWRGSHYDVAGGDMPSDRAAGFSTEWPDEEPGNTVGHHSFMVVFQEAFGDTSTATGTMRGLVINGAGLSVNLRGTNVDVTGNIAADGSFGFDNVPAGTYTVSVVGTQVSSTVTVMAGQQSFVTLNVPIAPPPEDDDIDELRRRIEQLEAQVALLQQQLAKVITDRDRLSSVLAEIKAELRNAGF